MLRHVKAIRESLIQKDEHPLYINGSWTLSKDTVQLYFKEEDGSAHVLQFPSSSDEYELLLKACNQGSGSKQYGEMDRTRFATSLEGLSTVSAEEVARQLSIFNNDNELLDDGVGVELQSLSVCGPGSPPIAVKANQATPSFLGSLIVILPSNFKGGQLLLRQSERECSYDFKSSHMHSNDRVTVSWVAFLKGVEQHVRPVSEGYRIVLTYNLFKSSGLQRSLSIGSSNLSETINQALSDHGFLPSGGYFAYKLTNNYPVTMKSDFSKITLQGTDSGIFNTFAAHGMKGEIKALYNIPDHDAENGSENEDITLFAPRYVEIETDDINVPYSAHPVADAFKNAKDTLRLRSYQDLHADLEKGMDTRYPCALWLTSTYGGEGTKMLQTYQHPESASGMEEQESYLCLLFEVPKWEERNRKKHAISDEI